MTTKRLAFLFLIYDEIEHEELWHRWFAGVDPVKYTIYIHHKVEKPLKYFEDRRLPQCIPTRYADISLVYAHNLLFMEALEDPTVCKFINLSQSCIPLKSFDHVYAELTADDNSRMNSAKKYVNIRSLLRLKALTQVIPLKDIYKSSEWFILNRMHADVCVRNMTLINIFATTEAPEEFYYATVLNKHQPEQVIFTSDLASGATTFTNWEGTNHPWPSTSKLKNYVDIGSDELLYLLQAPCLFGRKFRAGCTVDGSTPLLEFFAKGDYPGPPLFKPSTTE